MHFALTHPMVGHPYDPEIASGRGVTAVAAGAEAAGFGGFGFTDHPAPTQKWLDAGGHDALDPFVAMSFAAASTSTLRLIPNIVVLPYRNPFIVAKAGATLDLLSGGRFTLAVGTGYLRREFAALGVDYNERNNLFDESLDAINKIWTCDEVDFRGMSFEARGITAHPRPVSRSCPPIWIGGNTGRARQRVARFGQGWCPFPASAGVAGTAGTTALQTVRQIGDAIADLRVRFDAVNRDWSTLDVAFTNSKGGSPTDADFNVDEYLSGLADLAAAGVTWVQVSVPGDSLAHAVDTIERFGKQIISAM